jgi:PHP family Zn ribbon phosphoesterase
MKKMTCNQLGGACDLVFEANTFEEIAEQSKKHGIEMFQTGDAAHIEAMQNMKKVVSTPEAFQQWFEGKRDEFNALPVSN